MSAEARLRELGIELPTPVPPSANFVPAVQTGSLVFVSGHTPVVDGQLAVAGRVGADLSEEDGYRAARLCAINLLAALRAHVGSLDRVSRVVKLLGWVNCVDGYTRTPFVMNGASDLFAAVFGEAGRHTRSAIGANALPRNAAVEVEAVFELAEQRGGRPA